MSGIRDEAADQRQFTENARHEEGFAWVYGQIVAPHLEMLEDSWNRSGERRLRVRPVIGLGLIVLLWGAIWFWEAGRSHLSVQIIGGFITLLLCDLVFRRNVRPLATPGGILRKRLIEAVCTHVEGLSHRRVAGRRVDHDRFVALGLLPRYTASLAEDYFEGSHDALDFRMIEAELRDSRREVLFHGLLIEIGVPQTCEGPVIVLQNMDGRQTGYITPPGEKMAVRGHPDFARRFTVFAGDRDAMDALLSEPMKTALVRFDEQLHGAVFQAAFAFGNLMIAVPMAGTIPDPSSSVSRRFTPVGDAHLLLQQVNIPIRLIDTMHGIDPDTGGRYRAR